MQALLHTNKEGSATIFKSVMANFSELVKKQNDINKEFKQHRYEGTHSNSFNPNNNPDWIYTPPEDITQTRYFNGRTWYFCTKCGRNGRWVVTHSDDTHQPSGGTSQTDHRSFLHQGMVMIDLSTDTLTPDHNIFEHQNIGYPYTRRQRDGRFDRSRSRSPQNSRSSSPNVTRGRSVAFRPPTPCSPHAQLSLLESINSFLGEN